jgi:hypothetical protein
MGFILLTHKYLKQFAMKELRAIYIDSLVRVRVKFTRPILFIATCSRESRPVLSAR